MLRKLLPALLLATGSTASIAQIPTLTAANVNLVVNDSFITVNCNTTGVTQGPSGASQSWYFAGLVPSTSSYPIDTGHVVAAASASGYSLLSLVPGFAATHAVLTPSSTLTNFYNATSTKFSFSGLYYDFSDNAAYTDPIDVFRFPFTFGTNFVDPYAGLTYLGTTITETGNATVNCDGYGTLTLPPIPPSLSPANYTGVLRVHSYRTFRDSLDIFGSTPQTDTMDSYTWYQPGYHSALLTITTVTGTSVNSKVVTYAQKQIANHEAVQDVNAIRNSLTVFPNPATGTINIQFAANRGNVRVTLLDMMGREAALIADGPAYGRQNISYDATALSHGMYMLLVNSGTETVTQKVELQ